jgi:hypothetical protein
VIFLLEIEGSSLLDSIQGASNRRGVQRRNVPAAIRIMAVRSANEEACDDGWPDIFFACDSTRSITAAPFQMQVGRSPGAGTEERSKST